VLHGDAVLFRNVFVDAVESRWAHRPVQEREPLAHLQRGLLVFFAHGRSLREVDEKETRIDRKYIQKGRKRDKNWWKIYTKGTKKRQELMEKIYKREEKETRIDGKYIQKGGKHGRGACEWYT
jgi:hypothetical protein